MPWLEDLKFPRGYQMGTHKTLKDVDKLNCMTVNQIIQTLFQ